MATKHAIPTVPKTTEVELVGEDESSSPSSATDGVVVAGSPVGAEEDCTVGTEEDCSVGTDEGPCTEGKSLHSG